MTILVDLDRVHPVDDRPMRHHGPASGPRGRLDV
jgi:hypothetical protein